MTIETSQPTNNGAEFVELPRLQSHEGEPITNADIKEWMDGCDKSLFRLLSGISNAAIGAGGADIRRPS